MTHGISVEVNIPPTVDPQSVIAIGATVCPVETDEEMSLADALEWAFSSSVGVMQLALLGVSWSTAHTGPQEAA
jgi:hypothetical protein